MHAEAEGSTRNREPSAEAYHAHQISSFAAAGADMTTAITMTNAPEDIEQIGDACRGCV